jgi:hypothetical protein
MKYGASGPKIESSEFVTELEKMFLVVDTAKDGVPCNKITTPRLPRKPIARV